MDERYLYLIRKKLQSTKISNPRLMKTKSWRRILILNICWNDYKGLKLNVTWW